MAADYSGPRRARVELMADGRQLQTFVGEPLETVRRMSHACDGDCRPAVEQCHAPIAAFRPCCAADTGETVVRDPTAQPTSSSPFDRERQRAIILQAANSVNLFVKPVTISDEAAIRAQKAGRRRHASLWAHCRWPPCVRSVTTPWLVLVVSCARAGCRSRRGSTSQQSLYSQSSWCSSTSSRSRPFACRRPSTPTPTTKRSRALSPAAPAPTPQRCKTPSSWSSARPVTSRSTPVAH